MLAPVWLMQEKNENIERDLNRGSREASFSFNFLGEDEKNREKNPVRFEILLLECLYPLSDETEKRKKFGVFPERRISEGRRACSLGQLRQL